MASEHVDLNLLQLRVTRASANIKAIVIVPSTGGNGEEPVAKN